MGGEILIPLVVVVGLFVLAGFAVRWAMVATKQGAKADQKLDDLAQVSRRETGAQDELTKAKPTLDALRARWKRRLDRLRKPGSPGGGTGPGA